MKKLSLVLLVVLLMGLLGTSGFAKITGNGAPNGPHFTLNIIGTAEKNMPDGIDNGHVIFVRYDKRSKVNTDIWLSQEEGVNEFQVLDKNGTDGDASFQLPNDLYITADGETITSKYTVYVRALGKPFGSAEITPGGYFEDEIDGWVRVESEISYVATRNPGKQKFENVTKELFTITCDLDGDSVMEVYPLFSDAMENYFWSYDNNGLRHLQMRFYEETMELYSIIE